MLNPNASKFSIDDMLYFFVYFRPEFFFRRIKEQVDIVNREEILLKASLQWQADDKFWQEFKMFLTQYHELCSTTTYNKDELVLKTKCFSYLTFKKTPFLKFDIVNEEGKPILIKTRQDIYSNSEKIFKFYLYSSGIDQIDVLLAPFKFSALLNSMFLSNPFEILKRYKKREKELSISVYFYQVYSQLRKIKFFGKSEKPNESISHSKIFRYFVFWVKKKARQTLFKLFKKELQGYYEKRKDLHERILKELTESGQFDNLLIKSGKSLIEIQRSDSPTARIKYIYHLYLFRFPYFFCRDYYKLYLKNNPEMITSDNIQIRDFWCTFINEAESFLDWIILIHNIWPKDAVNIFGILERLIFDFSIHSDFNINAKQEGLIKTSLLKSLKDPLKCKTKGNELIHSVFAEING